MKDKLALVLFATLSTDPLVGKVIIDSYNGSPNPAYMQTNITLSNDGVLNVVNEVFKELNYKTMVNHEKLSIARF
jgi:hypothetical protein